MPLSPSVIDPSRKSLSWGLSLGAIALLGIGSLGISYLAEPSSYEGPQDPYLEYNLAVKIEQARMEKFSMPVPMHPQEFHLYEVTQEDGRQVIRMQLKPGTDIITLDATTGSVLHTDSCNDSAIAR